MFWCLFSSRFGFVALLIIFSFQTFSSFLGSLGNPQWQRMSKIMFTFIFVLGGFFFFGARTNLSPVLWMGKELFPRDRSHRSEVGQPIPPTAEANVHRYTPHSPTFLHDKWLN